MKAGLTLEELREEREIVVRSLARPEEISEGQAGAIRLLLEDLNRRIRDRERMIAASE